MTYKSRAPFQSAAFTETQRNFTTFDKSLTSGLTDVVIQSPGDFLYIDQASTGVVRVELNMRQGGSLAPITLAAGGSIECDFSSIKINADAQLNKSVRIVIGNGARIKGGANVNSSSMSVKVVDGGIDRTRANVSFSGTTNAAASAGLYPHIQLMNPTGSGKNLIVKSLSFSLSSAGIVYVRPYDTALANLINNPLSRYLGQAASVGQMRNEGNAALLGSATLDICIVTAAANLTRVYSEPILITPGKGLMLIGNVLASQLFSTIDFIEE